MRLTVLLKNLMPFVFVSILLSISTICVVYILQNTIWKQKALPYSSIQGVDVSLYSEQEIYDIYEQRFKLPQSVVINIENEQKTLNLSAINTRLSPSPEEIVAHGKVRMDEFIENIDNIYTSKEYIPEVVFDEMLLKDWLVNNFQLPGIIEKELPVFEKAADNEVIKCNEGKEGRGIPFEDITEALKIYGNFYNLSYKLKAYTFSIDELQTSRLCSSYNLLYSKLGMAGEEQLFRYWEVANYFLIYEQNADFRIKLKDEKGLIQKLNQLASSKDITEVYPEIRIYQGTAYFLGNYKPSNKLNIEKTVMALKADINNPRAFNGFKLIFEKSVLPTNYQGYPVVEYSKLVSTGQAKFKYEKWRDYTIASINKGLKVLDGRIIPANIQYSLSEDGLEARTYLYTVEGAYQANNGSYDYNAGICGVATVMYRAALLAGLPIVERHSHKQALKGYTYPYGGLVDAALYFRADMKQDLKFENNYDYDLLIVTDSKLENEEFEYQIRLFSQAGLPIRSVQLTDFQREQKPKGLPFNEQFTRYVDGVPEVIKSKYYINEL